jgi:metal transporter CNNM
VWQCRGKYSTYSFDGLGRCRGKCVSNLYPRHHPIWRNNAPSIFRPACAQGKFISDALAKPIALLLDGLLGKEGIEYFRERDLRELIKRHMGSEHVDIDHIEGLGALNFLAIDDIPVSDEGEVLDESSVIRLPRDIDLPRIPAFESKGEDPFVQRVQASGKRWIVFTDETDEPLLVLDSNAFLRAVLEGKKTKINAYAYCHRPIVVRDPAMRLGDAIIQLTVEAQVILVWGDEKRVISGADLLGRLLRGIVRRKPLAGDGADTLSPRRI